MSNARTPSLRFHKPSGRAVTTIDGRDYYCGPYGSPEASAEYDRLISLWLASGRRMAEREELSVSELMLRYVEFASSYYRKSGRPTSEQAQIKAALRPVRRLFSTTLAAEFGPLKLKATRASLVAENYCRKIVNSHTDRIKRMFKWAASEELVPPSIHHGLRSVSGLRKGRSAARESDPVRPVPDAHVDAIQPHVSREVWGMLELQRLTGMRSGEVTSMRWSDIDVTGAGWAYRPAEHKTEHHDCERVVALGPRTQVILNKFKRPELDAAIFSPIAAETARSVARRKARRTPLWASHIRLQQRKRAKSQCRAVRDHYDTDSYRRAIQRGCDLAFPPTGHLAKRQGETVSAWSARLTDEQSAELKEWRKAHRWFPHQLRHSHATTVRRQFGLEAAQISLGHSSADITQLYAERDLTLAKMVAAKIG